MNQSSNIFAAVDIGTTKVVAIVGKKEDNGEISVLAIDKVASSGVKRGVVLNIEETVNAVRTVIRKVEDKLSMKLSWVCVGVAGQHIKSIHNKVECIIDPNSEITKFDLDQLFKDNFAMPLDEGNVILHAIPQDYRVDNECGVRNPVGMSGRILEGNFHIVLGNEASKKNLEKCINRVGLELHDLVLEPLASSKAILTEPEREAGVVLVDIGGGTTDVAVFHDGILRHTAVIPFGGNAVTNDIKEGCSVLLKQAEALKIQYGSALAEMAREDMVVTIPGMPGWEAKEISFKKLAYIIQARMEEIIDCVVFQIEKSGYAEKLGAGIVVTGGGARLTNGLQLIKSRSGLPVRLGSPDHLLVESYLEEADLPLFSTSVGLLLSAFEKPVKVVVEQELFGELKADRPKVTKKKASVKREKVKKERTDYTTGDLFGSLKKSIAGIFDEKDVEM